MPSRCNRARRGEKPRHLVTNSDAHIAGAAEILAAGLMRLCARKSSKTSREKAEFPLDFLPAESGHPTHSDAESGR
jgi:hypothetical protein